MSFALGCRLGCVLGSLFGTHALFTGSDTVREILDCLGRQGIEDFLDYVRGALFVARLDIEVGNDRERQGGSLWRRSESATRVMLVIAHPGMTDGLEQRRRGTVRLCGRGAAGFKNSNRVKVRHKRKRCPLYRGQPLFTQGRTARGERPGA